MPLIPLRGKLIVENISDVKMTESGLYLAENIKEVPHRGKIIALGRPFMDKKLKEHPWDVELGEIAHFRRKWTEFKETHYCLLRDDVFAVEGESGELRAVRDMVIVERVYTGKIANSSIVIPGTYGIESNYEDFFGLVVSVGKDDRFGVEIGDKLIYSRNEGLEVKLPNGKIYWSLKPRAIQAIIK